MVANMGQHHILIRALELLEAGDSPSFEDALWLGFGDHWTRVLERLLRRRVARYHTRDDLYEMTDHGRDVLRSLRCEAVRLQPAMINEQGQMLA
ncbi:MAG: hypothetical protein H6810_00255 [Phycisphaeraceae bacterium]|nr:MAG: hypothetical protein H6810_00255 [Phycisphaeraceae bacterium]